MGTHDPGYGGMTVNERLFTAGLLQKWDDAIMSRSRDRAIEILTQVAMTPEGAAETVDAVLAAPSRYGYPQP